MTETSRNHFIDMIKGLAIFLMLWGHCIQYCVNGSSLDFFENGVFKFIYSFHMPLFMLVSGFLFFYSFSKRELKELLIHRTQAMLQPIFFCTIFYYFSTTVFFAALKGDFAPAFGGKWLNSLSSLWFLWSVLAASVAVSVIFKKCKNPILQAILLILAVQFVAMFPNKDLNIFMYPYFVLGFLYAKYKDKLPKAVSYLQYICLPLFPVLLFFYEKKHYIYTSGIKASANHTASEMLFIDAYRWLIGLVGSIFAIIILQLIYKHISTKIKRPLITNGLSRIGRRSLQIYVFSVPFLSTYLQKFFVKALSVFGIENIFVQNMFIYNFVFTPTLAILFTVALYYIIKLFDKIKLTRLMFAS